MTEFAKSAPCVDVKTFGLFCCRRPLQPVEPSIDRERHCMGMVHIKVWIWIWIFGGPWRSGAPEATPGINGPGVLWSNFSRPSVT